MKVVKEEVGRKEAGEWEWEWERESERQGTVHVTIHVSDKWKMYTYTVYTGVVGYGGCWAGPSRFVHPISFFFIIFLFWHHLLRKRVHPRFDLLVSLGHGPGPAQSGWRGR